MFTKDLEDKNIMRHYMKTRAQTYAQFCRRLAAQITLAEEKTKKVPTKHMVLILAIALSIFTGMSVTGLLDNITSKTVFDKEIHTGFLGVIPLHSSLNRTYIIDNPSDQPVYLKLKTKNWFPSETINCVKISWDYNELPLHPGDHVEINIKLENQSMESNIYVLVDLDVMGILCNSSD